MPANETEWHDRYFRCPSGGNCRDGVRHGGRFADKVYRARRRLLNTKRNIGVYKMQSLSATSAIRALPPNPHTKAWHALVRNAVLRQSRAAAVLCAEIALAAISFASALEVMKGAVGDSQPLSLLLAAMPAVLAFRAAAFLWTGLCCRSLRYATSLDLVCLTKTVAVGSPPVAVFLMWRFPAAHFSLGFFLVDAAFLIVLLGALHLGARTSQATHSAAGAKKKRRALVIGAGDAGAALLQEITRHGDSPFVPVGILDDDTSKWGRKICGVPVWGGTGEIAESTALLGAEEVFVCVPSATREQMRVILDACLRAGLPIRTLPPLSEIVSAGDLRDRRSARVSSRDLRPPQIEDLLNRDAIRIDTSEIECLIAGEVVLVTGAGGSIGSELVRQLAAAHPRKLVLVDKSENALFYAHREATEQLGGAGGRPYLLDLLDRERVRELMRNERPGIVFHAAANKHVAMMDLHPREAIRNNVLGTRNMAEAALEFGAERFVNISTDKAVNPRNWMGISKKLTELCIQELSTNVGTQFASVRFGNVAGSSGSVLRLFWERIERGEPVRVTDPRATRFFMSIREAVHLILRAAALGKCGETFVFEMGEPVNICELAKAMMLYSGLRPGRDLEIEFTGLQPGEKLDEELWEQWETPVASGSDHILVIRGRDPRSEGVLARISHAEELFARSADQEALDYLLALFPRFRRRESATRPLAAQESSPSLVQSVGAA